VPRNEVCKESHSLHLSSSAILSIYLVYVALTK
jgi:hypothetical protein